MNFDKIDISALSDIDYKKKIVLSDVQNKLTGTNGSSYVYAPQKGANKVEVQILDNFLVQVRDYFKFPELPADGAAGGIIYVLRNLFNA